MDVVLWELATFCFVPKHCLVEILFQIHSAFGKCKLKTCQEIKGIKRFGKCKLKTCQEMKGNKRCTSMRSGSLVCVQDGETRLKIFSSTKSLYMLNCEYINILYKNLVVLSLFSAQDKMCRLFQVTGEPFESFVNL